MEVHISTLNPDRCKGKKKTYRKSPAVKILESQANEAKRKKYPSIERAYLAPVTFRDDTANGLTRCIISHLRLNNHQAERINNTGRTIDQTTSFTDVCGRVRTIGSNKWIPGTGTNGTADISATICGRSIKIEVKIGHDRQSKAQKVYQQAVETAGGVYVIAKDFESYLLWYNLNFE